MRQEGSEKEEMIKDYLTRIVQESLYGFTDVQSRRALEIENRFKEIAYSHIEMKKNQCHLMDKTDNACKEFARISSNFSILKTLYEQEFDLINNKLSSLNESILELTQVMQLLAKHLGTKKKKEEDVRTDSDSKGQRKNVPTKVPRVR